MVAPAAQNPIFLNSYMTSARQLFALELSFGVLVFITGVLLFAVFRIIAACIGLALRRVWLNKNGRKSRIGRVIALFIGIARAFMYSASLLIIINLLAGASFMLNTTQHIQNSTIVSSLSNTSISISHRVLSQNPNHPRFEALIRAAGFDSPMDY